MTAMDQQITEMTKTRNHMKAIVMSHNTLKYDKHKM
jgi:hypothetical protein